MNKEKPFTLHKMTDLFVSSAIRQACIGGLHNDKCFYRLVLGFGGGLFRLQARRHNRRLRAG